MATVAPIPISPVSPIQIPCKLILDYDFDEDPFPLCNLMPPTPTIGSPCTRSLGKRTRTADFRAVAAMCSSPKKRQTLRANTNKQPKPRRVKTKNRRVRFRQGSKQFDGLKPLSEALETTVWNFYTVQSIQSADDILSLFKSRPQFRMVFEQVGSALSHLVELLEKASHDATVPVLPEGGGRGLLLGSAHSPTFKHLRDMFALALKRV